ncbi:putative methionine-R-sulfoxide reductase with GAF domain [Pararhizobium capsulatum DSM 1112]|uniref:Methionine-R-sulfoxide reductase with GAF domain n=1 Tax=Pararhizobium capsulatum DSM 1112 TaxID=1121113 RepID=A0ABU0C0H5_9HYPH|nr:putative methionine-R-sulfoxide reductase with GAF domain [Pararhizobium capsulatum DSM 1112]
MFDAKAIADTGKPDFYHELGSQLHALLSRESDAIANAANTSALIFQMLPDLNWGGFKSP